MKIAIPTRQNSLDSEIDERFGRAKGFIVYDSDTGTYEWVDNKQSVQSTQGAGIQSAKNVIDSGAEILIAGNVGPKAYSILRASGVDVYICDVMKASQAISEFKNGKLKKASEATVESHWQ
ncbi:MAG: NifB/NifX family molybdenum-iron cluster-binding protein [Spirochaetota bacterium]